MSELTFESKQLGPDRLLLKLAGKLTGENWDGLKDFTAETAKLIERMHEESGKTVSCVFDLMGVTEARDPLVIEALVEYQKSNKPHIYRTALIIHDVQVRLAMNVIAELADRHNIRIFSDYKEGEAWAYSSAD